MPNGYPTRLYRLRTGLSTGYGHCVHRFLWCLMVSPINCYFSVKEPKSGQHLFPRPQAGRGRQEKICSRKAAQIFAKVQKPVKRTEENARRQKFRNEPRSSWHRNNRLIVFLPLLNAPVFKVPLLHIGIALVVDVVERSAPRDEVGREVVDVQPRRVQ